MEFKRQKLYGHEMDDHIKWLEDHTEEYLREIEIADENEETGKGSLTKEEL